MKPKCAKCRNTEHYCSCPTFSPVDTYIEKPSIYTCAWAGCNHQGVISESTNGGSFYCREHAREIIGWYS